MSTWTRRFLLIPSAEAGPDSLISASTKSGAEGSDSPSVVQPQEGKRYRLFSTVAVQGQAGQAGYPVAGPGVRLFDYSNENKRYAGGPNPSKGSIVPRLAGTPEASASGNLLISSADSITAQRYTFNQAEVDRLSVIQYTPVYTYNSYTVPGDAQYRQSPVTLGKTKDLLHTTYVFKNSQSIWEMPYYTEGQNAEEVFVSPGEGPSSSMISSRKRDSQKYLTNPKLLALSDGRLMCCWMSTFLPSALSRMELESGQFPHERNGAYAPGVVGAGYWPPTNGFRSQVFMSFLSPDTMKWSDITELDQFSVSLNSISSGANGALGNIIGDSSSPANAWCAATFFDVVECSDTSEIVAVWGGNQRKPNYLYSAQYQIPGSDPPVYQTRNLYLNEEAFKTESRFIGCAASSDGGETWEMRSMFTDNGNILNDDIPGFTNATRGGVDGTPPAMSGMILSGCVERLESGRVIAPIVCRDRVVCLVSDDRGSTWRSNDIKTYADGWRSSEQIGQEMDLPFTSENVKPSGWCWAGIDVSKTRNGEAAIALTIPDDGFWFNVFETGQPLLLYSGEGSNLSIPTSSSRAFHGQSVFVFSTSDGESFGEPMRISNWGCSNSPVIPAAPGMDQSPQVDVEYAPAHNHLIERSPGGTSVSISMRPDGYMQIYLSAHNWGDSMTGDFLATRTISVRDISGGQSAEEGLPTYWSQYIQSTYTITTVPPNAGFAGGYDPTSANPKGINRSYGMLPCNIGFATNKGRGWLGSIGPQYAQQVVDIEATSPEFVQGTESDAVPFPYGFYANWQNPPASNETHFTEVYTITSNPDDINGSHLQYAGYVPRDERTDGLLVLIGSNIAVDSPFFGQQAKAAIWDVTLPDPSQDPDDDPTGWWTFVDYERPFLGKLLKTAYFKSNIPNHPERAIAEPGKYLFGRNQTQGNQAWVYPYAVNFTQDNWPDPRIAFNGVESVASELWRGETVVAAGSIDMKHYRVRTPRDSATPYEEYYITNYDQNPEGSPDFPFNYVPSYGPGSILPYNYDCADWSSIVIHRTSYWQPLRENIPVSLNIAATSRTTLFRSDWFPSLLRRQVIATGGNPPLEYGNVIISAGAGINQPAECSGLGRKREQSGVGAYTITFPGGEVYENFDQIWLKKTLTGKAFTFCWDCNVAPDAGGNYAIRVGQPIHLPGVAMGIQGTLADNPIRLKTNDDPSTHLFSVSDPAFPQPSYYVIIKNTNSLGLNWKFNNKAFSVLNSGPDGQDFFVELPFDNTGQNPVVQGEMVPCIPGTSKLWDRMETSTLEADNVRSREGGCLEVLGALVYTTAYPGLADPSQQEIFSALNKYQDLPNFTCFDRYGAGEIGDPSRVINSPNGSPAIMGTGLTSVVRANVCPVLGDNAKLSFVVDEPPYTLSNNGCSYIELGLSKATGGFDLTTSDPEYYQCGWRVMFEVDTTTYSTPHILVYAVDRKGKKPFDEAGNTLIQAPAIFPLSEFSGTENFDDRWLEVIVSTQETHNYAESGYEPPQPEVRLSVFVRRWDKKKDPDFLAPFETICWNYLIDVTRQSNSSTPGASSWRQDFLEWGNAVFSPVAAGTYLSRSGVGSLWKSVSLNRSDTPVISGSGQTLTSSSTTALELVETSILSKAAFGSSTQTGGTYIFDNASPNKFVPVDNDPASHNITTMPEDSEDAVTQLGPPYFPKLVPHSLLNVVDAGLFNATRGSLMSHNPPQHLERGMSVRWSGKARLPGSFSYKTSHLFSAGLALEAPTSQHWKSPKGSNDYQNISGQGVPEPATGGVAQDVGVQPIVNETVEIVLDSYGEHGYATDQDYLRWAFTQGSGSGSALGKKFHPTGFAVFGRNWPACMIELSDSLDFPLTHNGSAPFTTYQVCYGVPLGGMAFSDSGYSNYADVRYEPTKYTHLWYWGVTPHESPSDLNFPELGPFTFTFSGEPYALSGRINNYTDLATNTQRVADKAPWRPGQFKSQDNGPSFYLQIIDERHLGDSSSSDFQAARSRCIFKIIDNDQTTLYLDSDPTTHLPSSPSDFDSPNAGWRTAAIFSDRFGSQLNYANPLDPSNPGERPGDLRGEGFRYAKITVFGCTHFTKDDGNLKCGRFVLGDLYELSAPDFEWGWTISQDGGTNLVTTKAGPRYANIVHAPRRVFQVSYAPLEPAKSIGAGSGEDILDPTAPIRGYGGASPAGYTENRKTWSEVLDMIRRLNGSAVDCALFWQGELAMDAVPVPQGRQRFPVNPNLGMVSLPTLADPENILMVRLTSMGNAAHEGFMCKTTMDNPDSTTGYANKTAPRPIMSVKSLTFEEDF